jgi:hypothetical protein
MRNILIAILFLIPLISSAQGGYIRPGLIGWAPTAWDSTEWNLVLNPLTGKGKWANPGSGNDSIFEGGPDSLCFVVLLDTTCVELDSVIWYEDEVCFTDMGVETCLPYSTVSGNIYTIDGALTASRMLTIPSGMTFTFRRNDVGGGNSDPIRINSSGATSSVSMSNSTTSNTQAVLSLNNGASGAIYEHWNGTGTDEDYCIGINKTLNCFNIAEGTDSGNGTGQPFFSMFGGGDSTVVKKDMQVDAGLLDKDGDYGTSGYVLSSTGTEVNWIPAGAGAVKLNAITAADGTNTIDNTTYAQVWEWDMPSGAGLTISNTDGDAIHGISTGDGSAVRATQGSNLNPALYAENTFSGVAGQFNTDGGTPIQTYTNDATTNTVIPSLGMYRESSGGAGANGIGTSIQFFSEASGGAALLTNELKSFWVEANTVSRISEMTLTGRASGTQFDIISFEGNKTTRLNGRLQYKTGANVASSNTITLGYDGNVFPITGSTQMHAIVYTDWDAGAIVYLKFTGSPLIKHNDTSGTGSNSDLFWLAGGVDFAASPNDVLGLMWDGVAWLEVSRSVLPD